VKKLEDQMAFYAAYHQDARNKATHFIGVPLIMLSLFIPLAWLSIDIGGVTITAAMVLVAIVLAYYFVLDLPLGLAMLVVNALLLWAGDRIAALGTAQGWAWFGVLFVGGWILQLVGHVFEGRKPALADNLFQIFVAPIFLAAEVFFALGYKPELKKRIELSSTARTARTVPSS
jgi:uncharacterized membrane protein YGL010W